MIRVLFYTGLFFLFLTSCNSTVEDKASDANNDSIKKYLDLAGTGSLEIKTIDKYNARAFSFVNLSKNDTLTRYYLSSISFNYMRTKNLKLLNKVGKLHLEKSTNARDTLNLARYYRYKAGYLKNAFIYDSAYYYYIKAERFYKKTNDERGLAIVYRNKSQIQYEYDDYLGANFSASKAFAYFKKTDNFREQVHVLIVLGNTNSILKDYTKAINNFELALDIIKKNKLKNIAATCLNNLGNIYREQKKFNRAIYYFNLALRDKYLKYNDPGTYGFLLCNISYCKLQLRQYKGVKELLLKSIKSLNEGKDSGSIKESTISYIYLSTYFLTTQDTSKAQYYAKRALLIAKKSNAPYYYLTALSNAGAIDEKKASKYIQEYHKIHDSLFIANNKTKYQYYKIEFDTDELSKEKENAIKQKWIIGFISGIIIVVAILLLIITRQRSKQKELTLLQAQQKSNEEIYNLMLVQKSKEEQARHDEKKRIALELHDGVMNRLASTRLNLDMLHHKRDDITIEKCLNHIEEIYEIEQEIRSISHDLSLETFNPNNSFVALISDFIASQNKIFKTNYKLEMDESIYWENISGNIKMNLFRIIQEASHNINKFAQAENAVVSLVLDRDNICFSITDDGKGFDTEINKEGIGLKNIKQRVNSLNGKFTIQSTINKSTSLNIAIPIA